MRHEVSHQMRQQRRVVASHKQVELSACSSDARCGREVFAWQACKDTEHAEYQNPLVDLNTCCDPATTLNRAHVKTFCVQKSRIWPFNNVLTFTFLPGAEQRRCLVLKPTTTDGPQSAKFALQHMSRKRDQDLPCDTARYISSSEILSSAHRQCPHRRNRFAPRDPLL